MTDRPVVVHMAPRFTVAEALKFARSLYGLEGSAEQLPSERDQNFRIVTPGGETFVLKIANSTEQVETLDFQNAAMAHLAAAGLRECVPLLVPTLDGRAMAEVEGGKAGENVRHQVRLLTWVPGVPFARVKPHSEELLMSLGRAVGEMDRAFEGFEHPAMHRAFPWDLARTLETVDGGAGPVLESEQGFSPAQHRAALLDRIISRFEQSVVPRLGLLRRHVIHNDWNDYNVLVSDPSAPLAARVCAIDFGDMVHSIVVADLAVAAAYAMLDQPDPIAAAAALVTGYQDAHPLTEDEIAVLFDLIRARLAISVTMAARQAAAAPENAYLQISERQVWALIEKLDAVRPEWAEIVFRAACGRSAPRFEPCAAAAAVRRWLAANRDSFAPVMPGDLRGEPVTFLDFSVGSPDLPSIDIIGNERAMSAELFARLAKAGGHTGVGRYGEARLLYVTELFRHVHNWAEENRTVHLGIDLFRDAGTRVFAPLDGIVHSFDNNTASRDYGPTIILHHDVGNGIRFFTLYGHLSEESLEGLRVGRRVARGQTLARLGSVDVNGGWPPHLHFQVIVDMLGHSGNYPGVAAPSERDAWFSLCPDPNLVLGIPDAAFPPSPPDTEAILRTRAVHLGRNLGVSYRKPLTIVRGHRQYLFDADGRRFLDAVNNVPHVGHSHPRVVEAAARQLAVLTTNTRYLHPLLAAYAERLCALLPPPLEVCFIVSSGSEANELALRLAHAKTGRRGILVVDGAYHGNTTGLVDISPYKFNGPGGAGCPPHVRVVPYAAGRSARNHRSQQSFSSALQHAISALSSTPFGLAAFFCESLLSCAGQVVLPDGYLAFAYSAVRAAGGVCVADEVQVGFGRVGTHYWGFETQGVVPDIVTMGKPIGNGFPLGAVVTTREIADAFDNGMEYFNTFGGSPPACAVGMAVLDVMRDEGLQQHALEAGARLKAGLSELSRFPIVGDVRGLGLFLGVELVVDRDTMAPAARQADYVVNRMRERGILMSTDGPFHNVIKIKPPLPFTSADGERLVSTLAEILEEDAAQPGGTNRGRV